MKQWKMYILSLIWGPLLIMQIVLVFIFGIISEDRLEVLTYLGWIIWTISIIFGWLPIFIFKKKGGVPEGKNFVHTTSLVNSGLYAIIRHPQYTAGILFSLAIILISQDWLILVLGTIIIILLYFDILMADKHEIEKFGDAYKHYMKNVPRINFLLGIIRLLQRKNSK